MENSSGNPGGAAGTARPGSKTKEGGSDNRKAGSVPGSKGGQRPTWQALAGLMADVALRLLGEPSSKPSRDEWRYGTKGSFSVNLKDGTWYDHEIKEGGGVFTLIQQHHDKPYKWLREERLISDNT